MRPTNYLTAGSLICLLACAPPTPVTGTIPTYKTPKDSLGNYSDPIPTVNKDSMYTLDSSVSKFEVFPPEPTNRGVELSVRDAILYKYDNYYASACSTEVEARKEYAKTLSDQFENSISSCAQAVDSLNTLRSTAEHELEFTSNLLWASTIGNIITSAIILSALLFN